MLINSKPQQTNNKPLKGVPKEQIQRMFTTIIRHLNTYDDSRLSTQKDSETSQFATIEKVEPYPPFIHQHFEPIIKRKRKSS